MVTTATLTFSCLLHAHAVSAAGQFLPPSLATAMEELASTTDAKARNRYASP
jgi:hypothetical protein